MQRDNSKNTITIKIFGRKNITKNSINLLSSLKKSKIILILTVLNLKFHQVIDFINLVNGFIK